MMTGVNLDAKIVVAVRDDHSAGVATDAILILAAEDEAWHAEDGMTDAIQEMTDRPVMTTHYHVNSEGNVLKIGLPIKNPSDGN